jgi:hypothetical protein
MIDCHVAEIGLFSADINNLRSSLAGRDGDASGHGMTQYANMEALEKRRVVLGCCRLECEGDAHTCIA